MSSYLWDAYAIAVVVLIGAIFAVANWIDDSLPNPKCSLSCECGFHISRGRFESMRHYKARENEHLNGGCPLDAKERTP